MNPKLGDEWETDKRDERNERDERERQERYEMTSLFALNYFCYPNYDQRPLLWIKVNQGGATVLKTGTPAS